MYAILTPLVGALLTVMNNLNSVFASKVGFWASTIVLHAVGLAAATLATAVRREARLPGRLPPWSYAGGFVGIGIVLSCNYAFQNLDASLAVVLGLLGQILASLSVDATGFLGRAKTPIRLKSLPGIGLVALGAAVMAMAGRPGADKPSAAAILVAIVAGALPVISIALNSELGRKRGVLRSARTNYIVGLATTLALLLATRPSLAAAPAALLDAGPLLMTGGGLMGLCVVVSMNHIFPKVKAFTAALLMFGGQVAAGLAIDLFQGGRLRLPTLAGTMLVMGGLALKSWLERAVAARPEGSGAGAE